MYGLLASVLVLMAVPNPPTFAGVYTGELPAAGGPGRVFQLSLKLDGTASWRESYGDKGVVNSEGKWSAKGGKVTLTLPSTNQRITWTFESGATLKPSEWDHRIWGSLGPPNLKKLTGVRHIPEKPVVK